MSTRYGARKGAGRKPSTEKSEALSHFIITVI